MLIVYHPPKPVYNSKDFITRLTDDVDYLSYSFPQAGYFYGLDLSTFLADTGLILCAFTCNVCMHNKKATYLLTFL